MVVLGSSGGRIASRTRFVSIPVIMSRTGEIRPMGCL
jgi:hypothetical protein